MRRLGRYTLHRQVGAGGEARVHEATMHLGDSAPRRVALKVLSGPTEDPEREARIASLLRHQHLVDVYEVGEIDGLWFCAQEWCEGGPLSEYLPLPARAAVEVAIQVCDALIYAHEATGLIHLDLKPSNLLVSQGRIKVADLGIADADGFRKQRRAQGTPAYMAPEQRGLGTLDPRTDVYALGRTLEELVMGSFQPAAATVSLPQTGPAVTMDWTLEGPVTAPKPTLDGPLAEIIARCVQTRPQARYQDMGELRQALAALDLPGTGLAEVIGPPRHQRHDGAAARSPLVGRRSELEWLDERLGQPGLTVVKGPAGIGKSRLLAEAARDSLLPSVLIDLVDTHDTNQLAFAVHRALGLSGGTKDPDLRIRDALQAAGPLLLVLDPVEHLHRAIVPIVEAWCRHASGLRLALGTRDRLPLDTEVLELDPLGDNASRELLVAVAGHRGARIEDHPRLGELVDRLDGLPLALELAAGRLGVLTVDDILARSDDELLRRGSGGRHDTLQTALAQSWQPLPATTRQALADLTVFRGGFDRNSAAAVTDVSVLDVLLEHSMVRVAPDGRLDILRPIRSFVRDELPDRRSAAIRHGNWFAAQGDPDHLDTLFRHGGAGVFDRLIRELPNLTVACRRGLDRGDHDVAVRTLRAAFEVYLVQGPYEPGVSLARAVVDTVPKHALGWPLIILGRLLQLTGDPEGALACLDRLPDELPPRLARAHHAVRGMVAGDRGRYDQSLVHYQAALELARELSLRHYEASMLGNLGTVRHRLGEFEAARELLAECVSLSRRCGDRHLEAVHMGNLGLVIASMGLPEIAIRYLRQSLSLLRTLGIRATEAVVLGNLGNALVEMGQLDEGIAALSDGLGLQRRLGRRRSVGFALANLGSALAKAGRLQEARAHLTEALHLLVECRAERAVSIVQQELDRLDASPTSLAVDQS